MSKKLKLTPFIPSRKMVGKSYFQVPPKDMHHDVGFFVSSALRSHVRDFKPHSSRICEVTLDTLPHPVTIKTIYAPSTIDPPEADRNRKSQFWEDLEDLLLNHPNSSHIVVMGDCNALLDPYIDPTQIHVGPHVVGRRQTIPEVERDNALYLIDLLESHGLELAQTFVSLPFHRKVCYKGNDMPRPASHRLRCCRLDHS